VIFTSAVLRKERPAMDGVSAPSRLITLSSPKPKPKFGRPMAFGSVDELEEACADYFETMRKQKRPTTMSGLAVHLGVDRRTLIRYGEHPDFCRTIKRARAQIEADMEEGALTGQINPTVFIFSAKNNFGYTNDGGVADSPPPAQVTNNTQVNVVADSTQGRQIADKFVDFFSQQTIQQQPIIEGEVVHDH